MAQGRKTGGGSRKGSPNKATAAAKEAFQRLLDTNAAHFQAWLQGVAEGQKEFEPELDDNGQPVMENGQPKGRWEWLRRPDPATALKLCVDIAEFQMPKLARTTIDGELSVRGSLIIRD